jgi:hypothetical protein
MSADPIEVVAEGVVYRNSYPAIRTRHAWHPTLVHLEGSRWAVGFDLGEAAEAHRYGTRLTFSDDDCATWSEPQRILPAGDPPRSYSVRLNKMRDGQVVAAGAHHAARPANQGRLNPETFGYNGMELVLLRREGNDPSGHWSEPQVIAPPLTDTAFETCHAPVELSDGRWILPTCTWMNWDGSAPHGMKGILLVSHDRGRTWPEVIVTMDDWEHRITHFEQSVVELDGGALLAVAWSYNVDTGATGPTPYAISTDGQTFDVHGVTDLHAQTAKLVRLPDGRLLCAYRRHDERGLWLARVELDGTEWRTLSTQCIWAGAPSGMTGERNKADELSDLRFGFPQMVVRADGDVQLVFWARHEEINEIRWLRLAVPQ